MPNYRRNRLPGGTYFFTVNLLNRKSTLLTERINELREAVMAVRNQHPFYVDGWVVLPDHLHAIWTLPLGDDHYSERWRAIKLCRISTANVQPPKIVRKSYPTVLVDRTSR